MTADVIHDPVTDWCACTPEGDERCDYRLLADAVIARLNPRDGEGVRPDRRGTFPRCWIPPPVTCMMVIHRAGE